MNITYHGGDTIEIKTKQSNLRLSSDSQGSLVNDIKLVGAGEYEIGDVEMRGFDSGAYRFKTEGMTLVYLDGAKNLSQGEVEELGDVDILIAPASNAPDLITSIDPKLVIPVGEGLEAFCKAQQCDPAITSLRISSKDLPEDEHKIIVLKS